MCGTWGGLWQAPVYGIRSRWGWVEGALPGPRPACFPAEAAGRRLEASETDRRIDAWAGRIGASEARLSRATYGGRIGPQRARFGGLEEVGGSPMSALGGGEGAGAVHLRRVR